MDSKAKIHLLKPRIVELSERFARFSRHLDEIRSSNSIREGQIYYHDKRLASLEKYLGSQWSELSSIAVDIESNSHGEREIAKRINDLHEELNQIHTTTLPLLPLPSRPVELASFARLLCSDNEYANWNNYSIDLVLSDDCSEHVELHDHLVRKDNGELVESEAYDQVDASGERNKNTVLLFLPRTDSRSILRWPSLGHELGHIWLDENKIWDSFKSNVETLEFCKTIVSDIMPDAESDSTIDVLEKWLTEILADSLGIVMLGPGFFVAQLTMFLQFLNHHQFDSPRLGSPPSSFRLQFMLQLLKHRYRHLTIDLIKAGKIEDLFVSAMDYISISRGGGVYEFSVENEVDAKFENLRHVFFDFVKDLPAIKEGITPDELQLEDLNVLIDCLKQGEPIPLVADKPSSISAISYAACCYRNSSLIDQLYDKLKQLEHEEFGELTHRIDDSIGRSYQGAELAKAMARENISPSLDALVKFEPTQNAGEGGAGLLSRNDILERLSISENNRHKLKVIPLLDPEEQLSSCSIDLRLGSTFEVFYDSYSGEPIDFLEKDESVSRSLGKDAVTVEIDLGRPITINPGQFILGHTLEYLQLPCDVGGQIDGRSSLARVGLQVHLTAGFVDIEFSGSLTLEIFNLGKRPLIVYPGMRVAQLRLFSSTLVKNLKPNGKYFGLLRHSKSRQIKDPELDVLRKIRDSLR